ncbi:winged helix-turn-helix domain-containing protein [Antarcticimicrobium sediminis]|uniref:LysR family transcriptional regulator n=1 Tax=Antarcticimicrobium sediminis TaxID=2546227 RepID=A0A4R5EQ06_9RHOB|nr:winged helix-turn-helix domain-containing protein [Antarcticimicrobium sediminis]TDE36737.1 LysR family transcriptional regulator [Antarcticimicrobium sediminis]
MTDAPLPEVSPTLRLRVLFDGGGWLGPGKADLMELIRETGSISAAGRRMGMSYKRAWSLIEELNTMFRAPLVQSVRGGAKGGGAQLTEIGDKVLAHYRTAERAAAKGARADLDALAALRPDMSGGK